MLEHLSSQTACRCGKGVYINQGMSRGVHPMSDHQMVLLLVSAAAFEGRQARPRIRTCHSKGCMLTCMLAVHLQRWSASAAGAGMRMLGVPGAHLLPRPCWQPEALCSTEAAWLTAALSWLNLHEDLTFLRPAVPQGDVCHALPQAGRRPHQRPSRGSEAHGLPG